MPGEIGVALPLTGTASLTAQHAAAGRVVQARTFQQLENEFLLEWAAQHNKNGRVVWSGADKAYAERFPSKPRLEISQVSRIAAFRGRLSRVISDQRSLMTA